MTRSTVWYGMLDPSVNWVCFRCRNVYRRTVRGPDTPTKPVSCATCGDNCERMGMRIRMPKKTNDKAWSRLLNYMASPTREHWAAYVRACGRRQKR